MSLLCNALITLPMRPHDAPNGSPRVTGAGSTQEQHLVIRGGRQLMLEVPQGGHLHQPDSRGTRQGHTRSALRSSAGCSCCLLRYQHVECDDALPPTSSRSRSSSTFASAAETSCTPRAHVTVCIRHDGMCEESGWRLHMNGLNDRHDECRRRGAQLACPEAALP